MVSTLNTSGVSLRAYLMAHSASSLSGGNDLRFFESLTGEMAPTFGKPEYFAWIARADAKWRAMQADAMMAELAQSGDDLP